MSGFERPTPDLDKIVEAWNSWRAGTDDVLPGRTMADLKIGGLDRVLTALASDEKAVPAIVDAWSGWERGRVGPQQTLEALAQAGFSDVVEALASPA